MKQPPRKAPKPAAKNRPQDSRIVSSTGAGSTSSGPSHPGAPLNDMAAHGVEQDTVAAAMPVNTKNSSEYGYQNAISPVECPTNEMPSTRTGAGTLSEKNASPKTGDAALEPTGVPGSLDHVRVNAEGQTLTTNGFLNASFTRAAQALAVTSSRTGRSPSTRRRHRSPRRARSRRFLSAFLRWRARFSRHRARRSWIRGQVLHR